MTEQTLETAIAKPGLSAASVNEQGKLENFQGTLLQGYSQIRPETFQHAYEIMRDRKTDFSLRNKWFYTADGNVYTFEDGKAYLYSTMRDLNPILKHIGEATRQLLSPAHNYKVEKTDLDAILKSDKVLKTGMDNLKLKFKNRNDEWGYFEIDTSKPQEFKTQDQLLLAIQKYGGGNLQEYIANMELLNKEGKIAKTRIWALNPKYIAEHAQEGAVARASWLYWFDGGSRFFAVGRLVDNSDNFVRGVPLEKKIAEGDALQNPYDQLYDAILKDPLAVNHLNDSRATGLLQLATNYFAAKQKQ